MRKSKKSLIIGSSIMKKKKRKRKKVKVAIG